MQAVLRCCGCRSVTSAGKTVGTRVGASRLLSTMASASVPRPPPAYEASNKQFAVILSSRVGRLAIRGRRGRGAAAEATRPPLSCTTAAQLLIGLPQRGAALHASCRTVPSTQSFALSRC